MKVLWSYAERRELPPLTLRQRYKVQSALAANRCADLAARLMRLAGAAGIYDIYPFARLLADVNAGRQHIANQVEMIARNAGATMLGGKAAPDFML
jgi:3-hydroxy-9,10-secoandrosta-1,3,5(10)-triene-9,17-dione monooxygenase